MALIARRFDAADLLLGGFEFAREVLLRETGLFAQRRNLQRHIPRLTRSREPLRKIRVSELLFEVKIKIGFLLHVILSCQSRIRSRAVVRSRVAMP